MENKIEAQNYLKETLLTSLRCKERFYEEHAGDLLRAAELMAKCIKANGKILIMGNGGSAADAQHMAAEMIGRLLTERRPLPALALTTDTSNITAVANDYSYDVIFLKQVEALARPEDVIIAISTSGNSKNVLLAVEKAKQIGCKIIALTGYEGGKLLPLSDVRMNVSLGRNSCRIQETHIFAIHSMVDLLDRYCLEFK